MTLMEIVTDIKKECFIQQPILTSVMQNYSGFCIVSLKCLLEKKNKLMVSIILKIVPQKIDLSHADTYNTRKMCQVKL